MGGGTTGREVRLGNDDAWSRRVTHVWARHKAPAQAVARQRLTLQRRERPSESASAFARLVADCHWLDRFTEVYTTIMHPRIVVAIHAIFVTALPLGAVGAQAAPARDEPVCLGFAFGVWKPKLDWRAAGHGDFPDSSRLQRAPDGRDWAIDGDKADSSLILFPAWWPVGVLVALPTRAPARGDTVSGEAVALRANVDSASPRARVRAWRVTCRSSF